MNLSYEIRSDLSRIEWDKVHAWLASSYWSPGISLERVQRGARNSALVLGAYTRPALSSPATQVAQVGYLRVVSDKSRFAYLCDVWVGDACRGQGIARGMVQHALNHPDFATCNWLLATADAHGVYARLGFVPLTNPERFMSKGQFCTAS